MTHTHKVFISFCHDDLAYKERLEEVCKHEFISRSVDTGDIPDGLTTETVRQKIRDENLRDSSVTIVLVGERTWQRKHVDWEISSSLRNTKLNPRSGLLGIILPTYEHPSPKKFNPYTIPPRLYDNLLCEYAKIYSWTTAPYRIQNYIHSAYLRKKRIEPDNSFPSYKYNKSGVRWYR